MALPSPDPFGLTDRHDYGRMLIAHLDFRGHALFQTFWKAKKERDNGEKKPASPTFQPLPPNRLRQDRFSRPAELPRLLAECAPCCAGQEPRQQRVRGKLRQLRRVRYESPRWWRPALSGFPTRPWIQTGRLCCKAANHL